MDTLIPLLPSYAELVKSLGTVALFLFIIFGKDFFKAWQYKKNGINRRSREDSHRSTDDGNGINTSHLFEIIEKQTLATIEYTHEAKNTNKMLAELIEGMEGRARKAINQHEEILTEIEKLDVPRRHRLA